MKKISQIVKSVRFKVNFSLVSGSHQWCDPGSVRFFSDFCNNGVNASAARPQIQEWFSFFKGGL